MKKAHTAILLISVLLLFCSCGAGEQEALAPKSPKADERDVLILRYEALTSDEESNDPSACTFDELEEDIELLQSLGYESVTVNVLIRYVKYDGELPVKPVVITVDDSKLYCMSKLLPMAERYGVKFSCALVGESTEAASEDADPSPERSYLDWQSVTALRQSGFFEFTNSTYALALDDRRSGCIKRDTEEDREYRLLFYNDIFALQNRCSEAAAFKPNAFTYPGGITDEQSELLVSECGFDATLTCEEGRNKLKKGDDSCLIGLCRRTIWH